MLRANLVAAAVLWCACGSSPPLDPSFSGTWQGSATFDLTGVPSYFISPGPEMVVAVSGTTGTISNICPGATGTANISGSGNVATFPGNVVCPAWTATGTWTCASVVFTYTSGTVTLFRGDAVEPKTLAVDASGTAVGCGTTYPAKATLYGTKL